MFDPESNPEAAIAAYFERIRYSGPRTPTFQVLSDLQDCHLHAVPYENLDILRGKELSLAPADLFDKIVTRRRGGYCFENNGLFRWLLEKLGFQVVSHFARFWRDEQNPPPKRRHHVLQVTVSGVPWLVDVGVGGVIPRRPIRMEAGLEQVQGDELYRLDPDPLFGWFLMEKKKGEWCRLHSFTEEPQFPKDFLMGNYWCQHAPESPFRKSPILGLRTREGRNTVSGTEFRLFRPDGVKTFTPTGQKAMSEALETHFGIVLDV